MTDATAGGMRATAHPKSSLLEQNALTRKRNAAESRFKAYGIAAIAVSLFTLFVMLWTILGDGFSSFFQAKMNFPITLTADVLDPKGNRNRDEMVKVTTIGYSKVLVASFVAEMEKKGVVGEGVSAKDIGETSILSRGEYLQPAEKVSFATPAFLRVIRSAGPARGGPGHPARPRRVPHAA